ncbi:MAG: ParA family protein, partial [Chloroflexi bacterium]|nr:ParA family protein [Chloroflexota bacterium]
HWYERKKDDPSLEFPLPEGKMEPLGYIVQQHSVRLSRPVKAYDQWVNRMPEEYARNLLDEQNGKFPASPETDEHRLATVKHYRSLVPMAQESRKPIFDLTAADGAIGGHSAAVNDARNDFKKLARKIIERAGLS